MLRLLVGIFIVLFVAGCSSKEEKILYKSYLNKATYHRLLGKTEKVEFFDNNGSVAVLTAAYRFIPNAKAVDARDEIFIVGVQFSNPEKSDMRFDLSTSSNEEEYVLTLNNKKPKKVVILDANDKRLENISFVTEWGTFYELTYAHAGVRPTLVFENMKYGQKKLYFSKVAKFTYTKKEF